MTYLNAKKYLASLPQETRGETAGTPFKQLLAALGNPQRTLKYLRLTGSNGKTVCAELLSAVYRQSDYTVGVLSTPNLEGPRFCIRINGRPLSMEQTAFLTERLRNTVRALALAEVSSEPNAPAFVPTRSEAFLCMALLAFEKAGCHFFLAESDPSLPDATRFLHAPIGAVICGTVPQDNRREMQKIRAGICHGIREIVSAPQNRVAYQMISDTCASVHCRLTVPDRSQAKPIRLTLRNTEFSYRGTVYRLSLCGRFQITNATIALEVLAMLARMGFPLSERQISEGLAQAKIPTKFEVLSLFPTVIADSTHSSAAVKPVCESLDDFRETVGSSVRLCLPDGELTDLFAKTLQDMNYTVTQTVLLSDRTDDTKVDGTLRFSRPKEVAEAALRDLADGEFLLISGHQSFAEAIRYEILKKLGF